MLRLRRFATPAVLLAVALALPLGAGCSAVDPTLIESGALIENLGVLRVQLPSFDEELDGIWLWRRSETTGQFEEVSEIRFLDTVVDGGQEFVEYQIMDPTGTPLDVTLSASVDRSGTSPELVLWVVRFGDPGEFKASVYNAAGESPLSEQTILL
jgi:hypothetical protein